MLPTAFNLLANQVKSDKGILICNGIDIDKTGDVERGEIKFHLFGTRFKMSAYLIDVDRYGTKRIEKTNVTVQFPFRS